jgi:JAB1/Mov34/MPN/PAD-1 ubiquitin protease
VSLNAEYGDWHGLVEYSHAVMEAVRLQAVGGFNSFGHGGLEIGGVLYGERRGDVVRIMASKELPCEHAQGPAFALSPNDEQVFRELMKPPPGMRTVGCYCSHTRSGIALNSNDCTILERFFGERGSVALIVKPTRFGPVEATFYVHGSADSGPHFSVLPQRHVETVPRHPAPVTATPAAVVNRALFRTISSLARRAGSLRWIWLGSAAAAAAILLISMRPAPSTAHVPDGLGLQAFQIADRQVRVEWNRRSAAIESAKSGTLEITDGASKYSLPLNAEQLRSSSLTYGRRSDTILVRLRLATGAEESVQLVAPPPIAASSFPESGTQVEAREERAAAIAPPGKAQVQPEAARAELKPFTLPVNGPSVSAEAELPEPPAVSGGPAPANPLAMLPKLSTSPPPPRVARMGRLIWSGDLERRGVLEVAGLKPSTGSVSGALPGTVAKLAAFPAEPARDGLKVYVTEAWRHNKTEAPGPSTGWNKLHYIWDPDRVRQISVVEAPSAENQFGRLVLRNEGRPCSAIVVEWKVE